MIIIHVRVLDGQLLEQMKKDTDNKIWLGKIK